MICCGGCGKVGLNESFVFQPWSGFSFAGAKHHQKKSLIKVKEPIFVPGTSCCTTISFSHVPHENLVFIVGFSNTKGCLTIGVCLVAPKSDCLTQVWVKQAPRGPL